jgi:hypothetical protein
VNDKIDKFDGFGLKDYGLLTPAITWRSAS